MNVASIVGIGIIFFITAIGTLQGSIRTLASLLGMVIAYQVTNNIYHNQVAQEQMNKSPYLWTFIGIFVAFTIAGYLIYGATKIQPIESFEGVFGFIFGLVCGWGIARFIFLYIVLYIGPESAWYSQILDNSSLANDIYIVSPYYYLINSPIPQQLLNPRIW